MGAHAGKGGQERFLKGIPAGAPPFATRLPGTTMEASRVRRRVSRREDIAASGDRRCAAAVEYQVVFETMS